MRNAHLKGRFTASGGSGNDVQVVLAAEDEHVNWKNGHVAKVLYSSGKITIGTLDVPISRSGIYYLAISNTFSAVSTKSVLSEVVLTYEKVNP